MAIIIFQKIKGLNLSSGVLIGSVGIIKSYFVWKVQQLEAAKYA